MTSELEFFVRRAISSDEPFLWEMLYQALYVPVGSSPFPREIVNHPDIRRYLENWGRLGDLGFVAVVQNTQQSIGAAWIRLFKEESRGYGYINDQTPELTIAVENEYRGNGIGEILLKKIIDASEKLYPQISLSVTRDNPARRLYSRNGFEVIDENESSVTMRKLICKT